MRLFRTNGDLKEREECAIVGGGGTNQRASFMNFTSHYSSYSYSYYFQHNFVCALFAWGPRNDSACRSRQRARKKEWEMVSPESKERERDGRTDGRREELREICREVIAQNERQLQLCGTHFEWRKQRESREKICTIGRKEICTTLLFSLSCLLLACSRVMNGKRRLTSRWVILICFRGICPCRSHVFEEKRNNEWMNEWKKKGLGKKRTNTCSF